MSVHIIHVNDPKANINEEFRCETKGAVFEKIATINVGGSYIVWPEGKEQWYESYVVVDLT